MARRSKPAEPKRKYQEVVGLLENFQYHLADENVRAKVQALIPVFHALRDLGSSLVDGSVGAARGRLLSYFRLNPGTVISAEELMVVAGISEWARRVRELRVEHGWAIATGVTIQEMAAEGELGDELGELKPDDYILLREEQDLESADRWQTANKIRKSPGGAKNKILDYMRSYVGTPLSGEELSYVTGDSNKEWARRVRELRTEEGWPIVTKQNGDPTLPVGYYLLEMDRQAPVHDRKISDSTRGAVLRRDGFRCVNPACRWHIDDWNKADPRILELHHKIPHAKKGSNEADNLITLCNVCHDSVHAGKLNLL